MKKRIIYFVLFISILSFGQAPQGFNYQATVRNSSGELITNQNVFFKFNVMLNSPTSLPVFSETHQAPTDDLGQVNLVIGTGTASVGSFSNINWSNGSYYLGIELNTGSGYVVMGTTQLLSVPYALYANTSGSIVNGESNFTHYIGELYGGGIVVSVWKVNGVEHGLIASLTDLTSSVTWSNSENANVLIGPASQSPRDGLSNTNAIVALHGGGTDYAAGICDLYSAGGFSDWYLPSIWELGQCYNAALIVNEVLGDANGFKSVPYWSSTEIDANFVMPLNFGYGLANQNDKFQSYSVRAVRRF